MKKKRRVNEEDVHNAGRAYALLGMTLDYKRALLTVGYYIYSS